VSSIETMVLTSSQSEVKRAAKMGEKEGKIRKIGYFIEF
jgi:hypothetical protein